MLLRGTSDAVPLVRSLVQNDQESVVVLLLDSDQNLVDMREIFRGTSDSVNARPKEILAAALRANAASLVVGHNHLGSDPTPSEDDIRFTVALQWACNAVGIRLVDHIVVAARDRYFSFREAKLLEANSSSGPKLAPRTHERDGR